ncbi:MAG TPA: restriction endonuclease subunit S [Flavobacteriaceae bacterium]|nr:restriction endonuclease subunit S [Flavobacteriaceae bacterium]
MKQYDTYKDSGIEWIGEIPSHWGVKKIKHRCYVKARVGWKGLKSDEFLKDGYAYLVTGSDFKNDKVDWKECYHIDQERYEEDRYIQLQNEDLLITKDGTIGKLAIVNNIDKPACLNSGIFVVRSTEEDFSTEFLFWILKSKLFTQFNEYTSYGSTIQHLYQNVFVEFGFTFPSIDEQTAIATYLDRKTAEIDSLIADKKRLLELYEEEKTVIINQAVTKGINQEVKLKDSGIEWLGEIPEHWEVKRLSWCFGIIGSGTTPKAGKEEYYYNGTFNWLLTGDLTDGEICETSKKITQKALDDHSSLKEYPKDSIVMAMYGATIGKLGILKIPTSVNQACCVMGAPKHFYNIFAFYLLLAARKEIINMSYGGGQPNISQELIKSFRVQVPPLDEQQSIVQYIEIECSRIESKIAKTEKLIDLLTEYRTALISEVVTGKVKVID